MVNVLLIALTQSQSLLADSADSSDVATRLAAHIEGGQSRAIGELETIVNINSDTMNFAGVKSVAMEYEKLFSELGFSSQWLDGEEFNRAGHLVVSYGDRGPKLLLIGHLDTVFAKNDPFNTFEKLDDRYTAGPGITDMKGGNMVMIMALRALKKENLLDQVQIKVVLTGDEEFSGEPLQKSKAALIDAAKWADIALGFEDGDSNVKTAVVARRGSVDWRLTIAAKSAHSSQIFQPDVGSGAIFEAARILNEFRTALSGYGSLTFNPGMIVGGTESEYATESSTGRAFGKNNVIAKSAIVTGGLRASSPEELAHAKQVMKEITGKSLVHSEATLEIAEGYPPMAPRESNYQLLSLYSSVSQELGFGAVEAVNPRNAGAADISFTAEWVDQALDGLGLMGSGGHTVNEKADMATLNINAQRAALLIYRLAQQYRAE